MILVFCFVFCFWLSLCSFWVSVCVIFKINSTIMKERNSPLKMWKSYINHRIIKNQKKQICSIYDCATTSMISNLFLFGFVNFVTVVSFLNFFEQVCLWLNVNKLSPWMSPWNFVNRVCFVFQFNFLVRDICSHKGSLVHYRGLH